MNDKNNWIRDYLGVTAWHKAGYTGGRGLTLTGEDIGKNPDSDYAHAQRTMQTFHEIAPDREVKYCGIRHVTAETEGDTMFVSMSSSIRTRDEIPERLTLFVSAGNDAEEDSNAYMRHDDIYGVGAVRLIVSRKQHGIPVEGATIHPTAALFTSLSEDVDFGSITGVFTDNDRIFEGTSCSAPVLAGMAALINDMAIEQHGRPLRHTEMYALLKDISVDICEEGKDEKVGWGMPILPPPNEIDLERYMTMDIYKDDDKINPVHKEDVYRAADLGLMLGYDGFFDPKGTLTREQAASVIVRLYDKIKEGT